MPGLTGNGHDRYPELDDPVRFIFSQSVRVFLEDRFKLNTKKYISTGLQFRNLYWILFSGFFTEGRFVFYSINSCGFK